MAKAPFTIVAVILELALILAGNGVPPSRLWRLLAAPAYAIHLGLSLILPGGFLVYATILIVCAAALDVAISFGDGRRSRP
jgi:hypothetical protein